MKRKNNQPLLNPQLIRDYGGYLREQERSISTIRKYTRDLETLYAFIPDGCITKGVLLRFKESLMERYSAASVNTILAALNGFLCYCGHPELRIRPLRIQKDYFCGEETELSREEYVRLIRTAELQGNHSLSLMMQTICSTGIRVSELRFITVEAVTQGRSQVFNKGKHRTVFLPDKLCHTLLSFIRDQKRTSGPVFVTRTGKPLDRSNIWRSMKALCDNAQVERRKVFPHNLRHLFARTYYGLEKDLSRLADILGHTSINTTRIYTMESGKVHARRMGRLRLVIT